MRLGLHTLSGIAAVPAVRAFAVSAVFWLIVYVYCDQALWRDPHGAYFHSEHIYDLGYSAVRQGEARAFLEQYSNATDATRPPPNHAGPNPAICAAMVTIRREHPDAARYFADAVGSMLEGLSPQERAALHVSILFANAPDPARHPDFNANWVSALTDHAAGYEGLSPADLAELQRLEEARDFQVKGVIDYTYVLEQCYHNTSAPYIAVFEDDIVFAADWLARTILGLQTLAAREAWTAPKTPWLYLRLFYAETFLVWDPDDWWYHNMLATFALVSLTTGTVLVLLRQLLCLRAGNPGARARCCGIPDGGLRLDVPTIAVLALVVAPAFTALVFMAGKYNLPMYALRRPWRGSLDSGTGGVVPMDNHGCCTQGLVFDRARVPELVAHLRKVGRGNTDIMIEDYAAETSLRRLALAEQALQHVGLMSSRGSRPVDAQSVWAFYFEESSADKVRRRQREAVERIDWAMFGGGA